METETNIEDSIELEISNRTRGITDIILEDGNINWRVLINCVVFQRYKVTESG